MRLIDADKLLEVLNKKSVPFNANVNDAILTAPTVDAVSKEEYDKLKDLCEQYKYERDALEDAQWNRDEVVHCRDCKRRDAMTCPRWPQRLSDDDCCSYGERKNDD